MLSFEHSFSIKDIEKCPQRPILKNAYAKNAFLGYPDTQSTPTTY